MIAKDGYPFIISALVATILFYIIPWYMGYCIFAAACTIFMVF